MHITRETFHRSADCWPRGIRRLDGRSRSVVGVVLRANNHMQ